MRKVLHLTIQQKSPQAVSMPKKIRLNQTLLMVACILGTKIGDAQPKPSKSSQDTVLLPSAPGFIHTKCRNQKYQGTNITRAYVPEDKVKWDIAFEDYHPTDYTSPVVLGTDKAPQDAQPPIWADLANYKLLQFNTCAQGINRMSHMGPYSLDASGRPSNPQGRTGITGRGLLGKWGPNHAADSIVTRWKRRKDGTIKMIEKKKVLEFVAIQRKDCGQWAIPGGMVDHREAITMALKREFMEEAMNSLGSATKSHKHTKVQHKVNQFFDDLTKQKEIYKGYVDDPRNTDNAWIETVVVNFHAEGKELAFFNPKPGDDAGRASWVEVSSKSKLYASHKAFLKKVATYRGAYW